MQATIYHNPRCSKSRQTLALLQEKGVHVEIIEYLKTPPDATTLTNLLRLLDMSPRALMRKKEAKETGLDDPSLSDAALIEGMVANPKVIERPIVVVDGKARLGRPPEAVLDLV